MLKKTSQKEFLQSIDDYYLNHNLNKTLKHPYFIGTVICSLITLFIIFLCLPVNKQIQMYYILSHPLIFIFSLILILLISRVQPLLSFSLLVFYGALFIESYRHAQQQLIPRNLNINKEGFTTVKNNKIDVPSKIKKKMKESEEDIRIQDLFKPGPFKKKFDEARQAQKEIFDSDDAEEAQLKLEMKKKERVKKEKFNNGRKGTKDHFVSIPLRKFNPSDKQDANLLLVMEHCEDIKNRIKYVYEDKKYLNKYIQDKLEEIIDLLDLVQNDD